MPRGTPAYCNPFRVSLLDALPFFGVAGVAPDWPSLLQHLARLGWRGAVVGAHGSGKTTLLATLERELAMIGQATQILRLDRNNPKAQDLRRMLATCSERIVLCDGAGHLGWYRWHVLRKATRHAAGLVLTTHQPRWLPTWITTTTSAALLHQIVQQLPPPAAELLEAAGGAATLFTNHRGNLRAALLALYDVAAAR
jgi:hypothetical protein